MSFSLDQAFVATYASRRPPFGFNGLGELVYLRTYSRIKSDGTQERWHETVERVVNGTYRMQERHITAQHLGWDAAKAQASAQEMYDRMWSMKFLPPGRGLWAMGSPLTEGRGLFAALNNCFSGNTLFMTDKGLVSFEDSVGQTVNVLNAAGEWSPAAVHSFGAQPTQTVSFRLQGLRSNLRREVIVTPNHRWLLSSGKVTTALAVGDVIPCNDPNYSDGDTSAYVHGLVFGDGTQHTYYPDRFMLRLCGAKATVKHLELLRGHPDIVSETVVGGDPFFTLRTPTNLKALPVGYNADQVSSFIHGWAATDGWTKPSGSICIDTQDASAAEWLKANAPYAGFIATGHGVDSSTTNFGERSAPLQRISLSQDPSLRYVVESITPGTTAEVYCVTEPVTQTFTLAGGILTGNCAFVSTENLVRDRAEPFTFLMDASMLGIGVGFDTKGAGKLKLHVPTPKSETNPYTFLVEDSREGWVAALKDLLMCYFKPNRRASTYDYSLVRPLGASIKGFGGVASGPEPLDQMLEAIRAVLDRDATSGDGTLSVTGIVDIMNLIGKCVVAGNVRRTAEIAFGDADSEEFINLKNYEVNPHRAEYGWTSNNSIFANIGMDYTNVATRVAMNGEPGFAWLDNMRGYSRMSGTPDNKDRRATGSNPCVEQTLESYELCCLCENFPNNHDSLEDFLVTLKYSYLYSKTVTLGNTPWPKTNRVLLRNRRIGMSHSGIQQAIARLGIEEYRQWCEAGFETIQRYDRVYSEWFAIPRSIKTTSIKPSGSVSLLAGATPGMHWPEAKTYTRRMRLSINSDLIGPLLDANYTVEQCIGDPSSVVVEIPVKIEDNVRTVAEVSMWEQLAMAAFLQRYWADNQVSSTITFDPEREGSQLANALNYYQYQLKGISFLPRLEYGAFPQMPYEACTEAEYDAAVAKLLPLNFATTHEAAEFERFCSNSTCSV